ncbi:hypothetical protein AN641_09050 [Candidatus Epulonipiscioides gigas]|nr:hypothetical protein AN641_09050 [Epulopiscium sp. SCG-C07WGA-EpuloA2]
MVLSSVSSVLLSNNISSYFNYDNLNYIKRVSVTVLIMALLFIPKFISKTQLKVRRKKCTNELVILEKEKKFLLLEEKIEEITDKQTMSENVPKSSSSNIVYFNKYKSSYDIPYLKQGDTHIRSENKIREPASVIYIENYLSHRYQRWRTN